MATRNIPKVPFSVVLPDMFQFVRNPIPILEKYHKNYGSTFQLKIGGGIPAIVSNEADFAQHILQKNHRNYKKSAIQTKTLNNFLGKGLLTSEGAYWLRQRRLIQPGFHRNRLAAIVGIMDQVIDKFFQEFDQKIEGQKELDLAPEMMMLAFRVVAESLFSTNVKEEELLELAHTITMIQEFLVKQIRLPFLNPWFKLSGALRRHIRLAEKAGSTITQYIEERRASAKSEDDLLQMLLDSRYEDTGEGMSNQQIRDESFVLFVAGHETTANALCWILYLLSKHPEAIEKIRIEHQEILQGNKPSFKDLPQLRYLSQVINESMRLYPPAWITDRTAIKEDEINGLPIPQNTMLVPFIYGVHRSENNWEAAHEFRPERFEDTKHGFRYLPFGGGPRLCIGNSFAIMEMQLIISQILLRYNFTLVKDQKIEAQPLVTLRPKYGIRFRFEIR